MKSIVVKMLLDAGIGCGADVDASCIGMNPERNRKMVDLAIKGEPLTKIAKCFDITSESVRRNLSTIARNQIMKPIREKRAKEKIDLINSGIVYSHCSSSNEDELRILLNRAIERVSEDDFFNLPAWKGRRRWVGVAVDFASGKDFDACVSGAGFSIKSSRLRGMNIIREACVSVEYATGRGLSD